MGNERRDSDRGSSRPQGGGQSRGGGSSGEHGPSDHGHAGGSEYFGSEYPESSNQETGGMQGSQAGRQDDDATPGGDMQSRHKDHGHEAGYKHWRAEQMKKLDEEYSTWSSERLTALGDEFDKWRSERSAKNQGSDNKGPSTETKK